MLPVLSWEVSGLPPCFTQNIYLYIYNLICCLHKISLALLNISTVLNSLKVIHPTPHFTELYLLHGNRTSYW